MKPATATIAAIARKFGMNMKVLYMRVRRAGLRHVQGTRHYSREELMKLAGKPMLRYRRWDGSESSNERYMTIPAAARACSISSGTLNSRVKAAGMQPVRGNWYDREALIKLARLPIRKQRLRDGSEAVSGSYVTIPAAARMHGLSPCTLWHRVKAAGLKPVHSNWYDREALVKLARRKRWQRRYENNPVPDSSSVHKQSAAPYLTISAAARICNIKHDTLRTRVRTAGLKPVHGCQYDREALLEIARRRYGHCASVGGGIRQDAPDNRDECVRCGKVDFGNDATLRNGLCFECFCHDYCKRRKSVKAERVN